MRRLGLGLGGEAVHAGLVVGVAAALLVQHRGDVLRLPVVEQAFHIFRRSVRALDERRLVADRLLLLVDRGDILAHAFGADLHVADRMIASRLWGRSPRRRRSAPSARASPAGNNCCARRRRRCPRRRRRPPVLSTTRMSVARASAARLEHLREMQGRAQAVDAGADDGVFRGLRHRHADLQRHIKLVRLWFSISGPGHRNGPHWPCEPHAGLLAHGGEPIVNQFLMWAQSGLTVQRRSTRDRAPKHRPCRHQSCQAEPGPRAISAYLQRAIETGRL